jgi:ribosomal protein S18 acetylase RimI-like enzyme
MSAAIRSAGPEDAENLSHLAQATFTETFGDQYPPDDLRRFLESSYAVDALRRSLADPDQGWFIAEDTSGEAVGYAQAGPCGLPHVEVTRSHGELKRIYVRRSQQGAGLGRALMERALAFIDDRFEGPVWVGVWSENLKAQRLYELYGFAKAGEYEFEVGDTRDHEFIMRRG